MQPLLHDTGTFGCIGAAVAAVHLLAHGRERQAELIEAAIGNAAAVALFPFRDTCMEGAGTHHLFVGLGVQNGITAARGAAVGLDPSVATLERFFGPRAGEAFDPALLAEGIGADGGWSRFEISAAYLKWHPVCAHLGSMLDCIEVLRERLGGLAPDRIAAIRVSLYATALQYDAPAPASDLAARFSFRHAAALALRFGTLRHDGFGPERLRHPDVTALAARVLLRADPRLDALYPVHRPAQVTLLMDDGREESAEVLVPKGDGTQGLSRAEVNCKARRLMDAAWGEGHFARIAGLLDGVEEGPSRRLPAELGQALRRPLALSQLPSEKSLLS